MGLVWCKNISDLTIPGYDRAARRGMLYDVSWDIYAVAGARGARRLDELPEGFTPPAIGRAEAVIEQVREVVPEVEVVDPTWLRFVGSDHSIEMSLGKAKHVRDVTFFVHGGDGAVAVVRRVCRALALAPYDTDTGELLTADSAPPPPPDDEPEERGKRRWWRR